MANSLLNQRSDTEVLTSSSKYSAPEPIPKNTVSTVSTRMVLRRCNAFLRGLAFSGASKNITRPIRR